MKAEAEEIFEMMIESMLAIKKFVNECDSEKKMNELFEETQSINEGEITLLVEVRNLPLKQLDEIVGIVNDLSSKIVYQEILKKAGQSLAQEIGQEISKNL